MRTGFCKSITGLAVPFILAVLLSGCDRVGLFDMAKNGADLVYSMGMDTSIKLDIARPDYHKQYDTLMGGIPTRIAAGSGAVYSEIAISIYTNFGSFSESWGALGGTPPNTVYFMTDRDDEVIILGDWAATYNLCRLHEDSYQKSDPFEDRTDITSLLGSYTPISMFKAAGSVYLIAFDGINSLKIFGISGGGLSEIVTHTISVSPPASPIKSAGRKGGYFYMLDNMSTIYKMDASTPGFTQEYGISSSFMAVTESEIYVLYVSANAQFMKINESAGFTPSLIRSFSAGSMGDILPFDGDGVAIRISGGTTDNGVWIYKDGDYTRIIDGPSDVMYVR